MHTPPQTPPYHGTLNGHSSALSAHSHVAYGATPGSAAATLGHPGHQGHPAAHGHPAATLGGHGHHLPHAHQKSNIGTLGRNTHVSSSTA